MPTKADGGIMTKPGTPPTPPNPAASVLDTLARLSDRGKAFNPVVDEVLRSEGYDPTSERGRILVLLDALSFVPPKQTRQRMTKVTSAVKKTA